MSTSTNTVVTVFLNAVSECPVCNKRLQRQMTLSEESLVTGNTTQMASYAAKQLRAEIQSTIVSRGWTDEMCGSCRDMDPEEREAVQNKNKVFKKQMDELRALERVKP